MNIAKPIEATGFFWLPGDATNQIPGSLHISVSGDAELHLSRYWDSPNRALDGPFMDTLENFDRFVGIVRIENRSNNVTLENCFIKTRSVPWGVGIATAIIVVNDVFLGHRYEANQEIKFSEIRFSVEGLSEWFAGPQFNVEHEFGDNKDQKSIKLEYSPPDKITFPLSDCKMELEISLDVSLSYEISNIEPKITNKTYISLKSKSLRSFEEFRSLVSKLHNFFCFAIYETVSLVSVTAFSSELTKNLYDEKIRMQPVNIYYCSLPRSQFTSKLSTNLMLLPYPKISKNFRDIINKWLVNYDIHRSLLDHYFCTQFGSNGYVDGKFLLLVQGIESMHRESTNDTYMNQHEFESLVTKAVEIMPKEHQNWFKDKLTFANELTLRRRLKDMLQPFWMFFENNERPKRKKYIISTIVQTRNYLTHYNSDLRRTSVESLKLYYLIQNIEVLFQLHLLQRIGLNRNSIRSIIDDNRKFSNKLKDN